ncbi:biotin--[acetyl-CoA-carboxylase] ligase [Candidatus Woesearchaeota archaeon]|nr:biotin--[acetyl-CoA-carboxylase] ligase [Candidatus Woesearchaeota archaeon]
MRFAFCFFDRLPSTNTKAMTMDPWSAVVAETQTRGRGRFDRSWSSGKGGAWFSLVLPLGEHPAELTFLASLAVYRVLRRMGMDVSIKWPNDLVHCHLKVCGILTENRYGQRDGKSVIGIGLNVNNKLPPSLQSKAASLKSLVGKSLPLNAIIRDIAGEFAKVYSIYTQKGFSPLLKEWKKACSTLGKDITVASIGGRFSGKAVGVDPQCRLLVKDAAGKIRIVTEGDIRILCRENVP